MIVYAVKVGVAAYFGFASIVDAECLWSSGFVLLCVMVFTELWATIHLQQHLVGWRQNEGEAQL